MELRLKAIKGAKWTTIQQVVDQLIGFLIFLLLARLLSPEDFGLVAYAGVFVAFMGPFITQGFVPAIIQRENLETEHLDTAFWANISIAVTTALLVSINAGAIAKLFDMPQMGPILACLSISFIFLALSSVQEALLRRSFGFKSLAVRSIVALIAGGIVGITMAFLDYGAWSLVGRQLVSSLVSALLLWRISKWRPRIGFSIRHFRELFHFGINIVGNQLLMFLNKRSDKLLIGYFLGPVALGYYSVAQRLLEMMTSLLSRTLQVVAMPTYARLQSNPEKLLRAFYKVTQSSALIVFPAFLGTLAILPEFVSAVFGEKWIDSIPVMQIFTLVGLLHCLMHAKDAVIVGMGKPAWQLGLEALYAIAYIIGLLITVKLGIVAVSISIFIVGCFMAPLWFYIVQRLIQISMKTYLSQYTVPAAASLVMLALIMLIKSLLANVVNNSVLLVICIPSGMLFYALAIQFLSPKLADLARELISVFLKKEKALGT